MSIPSPQGNLRSTLRRRRSQRNPMRERDQLPKPLRLWLSEAALPWSPASLRRVWVKALRQHGGDEGAALAELSQLEQRRLRRDAPLIWGQANPP